MCIRAIRHGGPLDHGGDPHRSHGPSPACLVSVVWSNEIERYQFELHQGNSQLALVINNR